jgi:hypothetical protein
MSSTLGIIRGPLNHPFLLRVHAVHNVHIISLVRIVNRSKLRMRP